VFALLMLAAPILLADDLDEFEAMMAEPAERRGWIDPMDMGLDNSGVGQSCDLGAVGKELQVCKEALRRALERNETTSKPVQETSTTDAFLKRHVSHLLQRLGLVSGQPAHLRVEIQLSSLDSSLLKNFITNKPASNVHDVVDVLGRMIKEVESFEKSPVLETIKEHLTSWKDPMITLSTACALVLVFISLARSLPPRRLAGVLLLFCLAWHWTHLYKTMWATKHSKLIQSGNVPPECRPRDMTWLQTIQSSARSVFSSVDRCEEYHKAIMVDPVYEVNPLTALVDLLTKLLLHPLSSLGTEVGLMFSGLLSSVPLFWKVPVLLVFVILLMFVLILVAGYRVRLPFFLGDISPAPRQPAAPAQSLAAEIQQLKSLLAEPGVRRASQPALQRQGSIVEEVDMVDCQLEEEEEEEMMLRRRCLSLTQLETRSFSLGSSLPSSPLGTPVKNRLLGTPSKSSPKGTSKKMAATPVRRPILTPVRSNPSLLTPVRNQKRETPSCEEEGGPAHCRGNVDELDLGQREETGMLQEGGSQEHLEDHTTVAHSAQHEEEALDLRVGLEAEGDLSGGVLLGSGKQTDVHLHQPHLLLEEREPVISSSSPQSQVAQSGLMECTTTGSPRKALIVAGDPQSPTTTSFGWMEGSLEGRSTLMKGELTVGSLLTERGEGTLEVTEREEVMVVEQISRSSDFLDKVEGVFHRSVEGTE